MSNIVVQLPNNEWAVCSICTTHPTKGAADKAANKMKTPEVTSLNLPPRKPTTELIGGLISKSKTQGDFSSEPDYLELCWEDRTYTFNFFVNKGGVYIATCSTPGCENFFGQATSWWGAAQDCMNKISIEVR